MVTPIGPQFQNFFFPEEKHAEDPYEMDIVIKEDLLDVNKEVPRTDHNCTMQCSYRCSCPCGTAGCVTAGCRVTESGSNCIC